MLQITATRHTAWPHSGPGVLQHPVVGNYFTSSHRKKIQIFTDTSAIREDLKICL